jgi:alanine racemase
MKQALAGHARPCLISRQQVKRWRAAGGGACDVMVDTGMNRLGLSLADVASGLLDGLEIDTLMSHLACADEPDNPKNQEQRNALAGLEGRTSASRLSLGNSAGIALGEDFGFDLTRPGLSLYGGIQSDALTDVIRPVVQPEAEVIQRRTIQSGDTVGYNATFKAERTMELAILNIGYADGYFRGFSGNGTARYGGDTCPVIGRVSMDLVAVCVDSSPDVSEGDFLAMDFDLRRAAAQSGMGQYELLTGLGSRYDRIWSDA